MTVTYQAAPNVLTTKIFFMKATEIPFVIIVMIVGSMVVVPCLCMPDDTIAVTIKYASRFNSKCKGNTWTYVERARVMAAKCDDSGKKAPFRVDVTDRLRKYCKGKGSSPCTVTNLKNVILVGQSEKNRFPGNPCLEIQYRCENIKEPPGTGTEYTGITDQQPQGSKEKYKHGVPHKSQRQSSTSKKWNINDGRSGFIAGITLCALFTISGLAYLFWKSNANRLRKHSEDKYMYNVRDAESYAQSNAGSLIPSRRASFRINPDLVKFEASRREEAGAAAASLPRSFWPAYAAYMTDPKLRASTISFERLCHSDMFAEGLPSNGHSARFSFQGLSNPASQYGGLGASVAANGGRIMKSASCSTETMGHSVTSSREPLCQAAQKSYSTQV